MNLQRFIDAKAAEIAALRRAHGEGNMPEPFAGVRGDFRAALQTPPPASEPLRVIAEFKRCSPSQGVINGSLDPAEAARIYAEGGAAAMSVLTEETYFLGSTADMLAAATAGLPLLRKDFLFDPLQVEQTMATPAAAMLLIVALTPDAALLRDLRQMGESAGIESVVEIFSERELDTAREAGARIIQVNARNLETFATDRSAGLRLARLHTDDETWIAASAMSDRRHLMEAAEAGYDAALVGTALMQTSQPGETLRSLLRQS